MALANRGWTSAFIPERWKSVRIHRPGHIAWNLCHMKINIRIDQDQVMYTRVTFYSQSLPKKFQQSRPGIFRARPTWTVLTRVRSAEPLHHHNDICGPVFQPGVTYIFYRYSLKKSWDITRDDRRYLLNREMIPEIIPWKNQRYTNTWKAIRRRSGLNISAGLRNSLSSPAVVAGAVTGSIQGMMWGRSWIFRRLEEWLNLILVKQFCKIIEDYSLLGEDAGV